MIPGLGTLKRWGLAAIAFIITLAGMFLAGRNAGAAREREKGQQAARGIEHKAVGAMTEGLKREQDEVEKVRRADPSRRDHFES